MNHKEAFCIMGYGCEKNSIHIELVWNSRDGVTPFCIDCRTCGAVAQHENWQGDRYEPNYIPTPGDRIFVDLTEQRAEEMAVKAVERWWDHSEFPMRERYESKPEATVEMAKSYLGSPGPPDLIEVTEEIRRVFLDRASARKSGDRFA